ncbi:MAG: hypothetical protein GY754_38935 [bacterium]|nr:hypothetical protein [bacterium]
MKKLTAIAIILLITLSFAVCAMAKDIILPELSTNAGMDIMQAIEQRASSRSFASQTVSLETIGAILWAGNGIIHKQGSKTAHGFDALSGATSQNRYSIPFGWESPYLRVYLLIKTGAYEYIPGKHQLRLLTKGNLISRSGTAASNAAGVIILCADYGKLSGGKTNTTRDAALLTAGSAAQNMRIIGTAHKVQMLTQVYFSGAQLKKKLKIPGNVEPLALVSFGSGGGR